MAEVDKSRRFNYLKTVKSAWCDSNILRPLRSHWIDIAFIILLLLCAVFYTYKLEYPVLGVIEPDEGLKLMIAQLVEQGYQLYSQIFTDNSPLYMGLLASFIHIFGTNPVFGRLAIVIFGLLGIIGVYAVGRELSGPKIGLLAAIFLAFSYRWYEYSRFIMEEVPSATLQVFTLLVLLKCLKTEQEKQEIFWAILTGMFLTASALMKTFSALNFFLVLPILIYFKRDWKLILAFFIGWAVPLIVFLPLDIEAAFTQMILHPINRPEKTSLSRNWQILRTYFWPFWPYNTTDRILIASWPEGNVSALALIGFIIAGISKKRDQMIVAIWTAFQAGYLFLWTSLYFHHVVLLNPFVPILAGFSAIRVKEAFSFIRNRLNNYSSLRHIRIGQKKEFITFILVILYLFAEITLLVGFATHPERIIEKDLTFTEADPPGLVNFPGEEKIWYEAISVIQAYSNPGDWILSDAPNLIYLANRRIVPELVDATFMRIASGFLDSEYTIEMAELYNVTLVVFWTRKLITLDDFVDYVHSNFTLIWDNEVDCQDCQIFTRNLT